MMKNKLFVFSGPSGVGKSTIIAKLLEQINNVAYSISATTREPRSGEIPGKDYFFVSEDVFTKGIENGDWLEWANVHGQYYGTPISFVMERLKAGEHVILEIDIQGAQIVKGRYPEAIFVFIAPPNFTDLVERLEKRGTDSLTQRELRLLNARKEITEAPNYDYVVVNDNLEKAIKDICEIIKKEEGGSLCE